MFSNSLSFHSLEEFVRSVPTCSQTATFSVLLEMFVSQGSELIVLVNERNQPIGYIAVGQAMLYLCQLQSASNQATPEVDRQLSCQVADLPLIEPLVVIAASASLAAFTSLQDLQNCQMQWAVVDAAGAFMGLLDQISLARVLYAQLLPARHRPQVKTVTLDDEDVSVTHLLPGLSSPQPEQQTWPVLDVLILLLEQLPLPLMLQTSTGQVLSQNASWKQQVGNFQDPAWIQQEAANFLESQHLTQLVKPVCGPSRESDAAQQFSLESMGLAMAPTPSTVSLCHATPDPESCVCVCPLKNGLEQVWQFTKIPLNPVLAEVQPDQIQQIQSDRFRLGTWRTEPDKNRPGQTCGRDETLWLILAQDRTEQQQVARELTAKNADLIQLNRLKDEFLSCISHELRTPLTAVLGLSSLLKEPVLGQLNERQSRYAQLIHDSGRHLMAIVNDILDLTRMETGQLELILDTVVLQDVCHRACMHAEHLCTESMQKKITLEIEPELSLLVADEARLYQMLINLLSNAMKFTEVSGEVGLKVSRWEGWIACTVWDTGIGIPDNKQHLIFQKFQQLENPLTRRFEGTGLGLVLTQRLARLHGGDVTFTSKEGQGSQFTLLLPPVPPQKGADEPNLELPPLPQRYSNRLVLVMEGVPRYIDQLNDQLARMGYRVAIARSGTEALEKTRRLQPCVVFLNPVLPLLSGWDVLTLLKSDPETAHIPVVVTATRADKEQAERNQADDFLSLPVQPKALDQVLARLMHQVWEKTHPKVLPSGLTILLLNAGGATVHTLGEMLQLHRHRVLEVDDLDQADLMARVWKSDLVIIHGVVDNAIAYIEHFSHYDSLASLPLITLTNEMTQAANRVKQLSVFPCLASTTAPSPDAGDSSNTSALLQVIQVAAGVTCKPSVLVIDPALLMDETHAEFPSTDQAGNLSVREWLQVLTHYIESAGFRGLIGSSWLEVLRQVQYQSVDLLLIYLRGNDKFLEPYSVTSRAMMNALLALERLESKPPILVLDYRYPSSGGSPLGHRLSSTEEDELSALLHQVADRVLYPFLSMQELIEQIVTVLKH